MQPPIIYICILKTDTSIHNMLHELRVLLGCLMYGDVTVTLTTLINKLCHMNSLIYKMNLHMLYLNKIRITIKEMNQIDSLKINSYEGNSRGKAS